MSNLNSPVPNGYVEIYDNNGKMIFSGKNMVLKSGREYIIQKGFFPVDDTGDLSVDNITNNDVDFAAYNDLVPRWICFSEVADETVYTNDEKTYLKEIVGITEISKDNAILNTKSENNLYYIEFTIPMSLKDEHQIIVSSAMILLDTSTSTSIYESNSIKTTIKPFSRIKFDPITLISGSNFTMKYRLYF